MLTSLSIKNFALIEDVNLQLREGMSIITGETGAGKSILLGALSLLLGKRADLSTVRDASKKCVVEGNFSISAYNLQAFFEENELDYDAQTIVRREILPSGKSRAFINDTPVKLSAMENLGNRLIDIHSQHETLSVGDTNYQFKIIDALAGNASELENYEKTYRHLNQLKKSLAELKTGQQEAAAVYDYNLFLLNELREANLKPGMQEELEEQQQQLSNVETLKENLGGALDLLQQEEIGNLASLREIKNRLAQIENISNEYKSFSERLKSAYLELEDISEELERSLNKVDDDPETLNVVNERLQVLYNLQKKHQVATVGELLEIQQTLAEKVSVTENADEAVSKLEAQIESAKNETQKIALQLHLNRKKAIPVFVAAVEKIVSNLGMPDAKLKVELQQLPNFNSFGNDEMSWKLSANKGSGFNELKKTASGGELSRITLAIKSILAEYSNLPTIIFDEIDTGISGDIAQKMGSILHSMGTNMQVVAITHLPQIAAKGDQHFKVFKTVKNNQTETNIAQLKKEERLIELAEMLGGNENQDSAMAHARALLN
ncbi:MAG TPA: DNA repair protein RecN [Flavobacteriaceae bacterium]|nr:DNA repair protein RecN [Flavobacteriaceae bacterium]